ncbi:MAG: uncharacterized protein A8A55_3067, partial [Amphiamblys sp. WSBS2006]
ETWFKSVFQTSETQRVRNFAAYLETTRRKHTAMTFITGAVVLAKKTDLSDSLLLEEEKPPVHKNHESMDVAQNAAFNVNSLEKSAAESDEVFGYKRIAAAVLWYHGIVNTDPRAGQ